MPPSDLGMIAAGLATVPLLRTMVASVSIERLWFSVIGRMSGAPRGP